MKRFDILDAWRSLAIVLMVIYHFLYDLALYGVITWEQMFCTPLNIMQKFICCSFILLAGASARFSRSNLRHGLIVIAAGVIVAIGAAVGGQTIRFGVLQLLGWSMVLYHFLGKYLQKIPGGFLAGVSGALFLLSDHMVERITVSSRWLYPLGLMYPGFSSADYFPLVPWFFLFVMGSVLGDWCLVHRENRLLTAPLPHAVTFLGRHSLIIYLLHQPILFGITSLIWG
ncbi:MAG: DUF1624 domain-containing protein [Oscillospiraceae bacterium]|nr:DUF1624 domain-containing protein [Oscillospiraceae bacterium]